MRTLKADKQEAEIEVNALLEGKTGKSGKTVIALFNKHRHLGDGGIAHCSL